MNAAVRESFVQGEERRRLCEIPLFTKRATATALGGQPRERWERSSTNSAKHRSVARGAHFPRCRAFTLIELLVVVGLVAVLGGAIAFGLGRAHEPMARSAAQNLAMSLVSAARAQAVLAQSEVMLLVDASGDPVSNPGFLRVLRLALLTNTGWRMSGEPVRLPTGVAVVPPAELPLAGVTFSGGWPARLHSNLLASSDPEAPPGFLRVARITGAGELASGAGSLVLAPARRDGAGVLFTDPHGCRGLILSAYGIATAVDEPQAFPEP